MEALGMIETYGLVPSIEAADAMLKAAEVKLLERTFVKGGLVTVTVVILELDTCFGKCVVQCGTYAGDVSITVSIIEYTYVQLSAVLSAVFSARYEAEHHNADQQ